MTLFTAIQSSMIGYENEQQRLSFPLPLQEIFLLKCFDDSEFPDPWFCQGFGDAVLPNAIGPTG
jgi:hypothetical protein